MEWETVIGLEVHLQLATDTKLFSGSALCFGAPTNQHANVVDLAYPGTLPVFNAAVIDHAIKFGIAIDADISHYSVLERKHYFYPDLAKGYQISQHRSPIIQQGHLLIPTAHGKRSIAIERAHIEEDAGKSIHHPADAYTEIDYNRAGAPLLEIVTEPVIHSPAEAVSYLKTLHTLVRYIGISEASMQAGAFRCDANVSVRPRGQHKLGTRTEIKNLNSFRFIEKAITYEVARQISQLESGQPIQQETRQYDSVNHQTKPLRQKEEAHDYRYFPDPDLLPICLTSDHINRIRAQMPELPQAKAARFQRDYALLDEDIERLISQPSLADYFETVMTLTEAPARLVNNWIVRELLGALNKANQTLAACPVQPQQLAQLLTRIHDATISGSTAKQVFDILWHKGGEPDKIIAAQGLQQRSDSTEIAQLVDTVLRENPKQVAEYQAGKSKLMSFFVGQVMRLSKGMANPQHVQQHIQKQLTRAE